MSPRNPCWTALLACLALAAAGCRHTRPEEMSVQAHRDEATRHQQVAEQEAQRYDPEARASALVTPPAFDEPLPPSAWRVYNPTEPSLQLAEVHRGYAKEHLAAAEALERFEAQECARIAPAARAACPLVTGAVVKVEERGDGVRLHLRPDAPGADIASRMRCHQAFAQARGFEDVPVCPLYGPGVSITLVEEGRAIDIISQSARGAADIRAQAREVFVPHKVLPHQAHGH
jgi:hypothetical protein